MNGPQPRQIWIKSLKLVGDLRLSPKGGEGGGGSKREEEIDAGGDINKKRIFLLFAAKQSG